MAKTDDGTQVCTSLNKMQRHTASARHPLASYASCGHKVTLIHFVALLKDVLFQGHMFSTNLMKMRGDKLSQQSPWPGLVYLEG